MVRLFGCEAVELCGKFVTSRVGQKVEEFAIPSAGDERVTMIKRLVLSQSHSTMSGDG